MAGKRRPGLLLRSSSLSSLTASSTSLRRSSSPKHQLRHANGRRVRADALPEFTAYRDTGCRLYSACLSCPLPACLQELHGPDRALRLVARNLRIAEDRRHGAAISSLVAKYTVSRRTVHRALSNPLVFH